MKIKMEDIKNEGFEIIEEVYNARLEAPIDLDGLDDTLDDLDYGSYEIVEEEEETHFDVSETFFSLYKDNENLLLTVSLAEIKEYLQKYFEDKEVQ